MDNQSEEFLNEILDRMLNKTRMDKKQLNEYVDSLSNMDISFKCLQASMKMNDTDSKILNKVVDKDNITVSKAYINLVTQLTTILEDFKKEYLGKEE